MSQTKENRIIDVYCRVSTEEQAASGLSLEYQEQRCRQYLEATNQQIGEVHLESASGKDLNRPRMKMLLDRLRSGRAHGICVLKLDRLSRSVVDLAKFSEESGDRDWDLIFVQDSIDPSTPAGRMFYNIMGVFAQFEREVIRDRTRIAMQGLVSKGFYTGGHVPAGLEAIQIPNSKHKVLVASEEYGEVVSVIWRMVVDGASLLDVAGYLNENSVPSGKKPWDKDKVRRLVLNDRVVGLLVSEEVFKEFRLVLTSRHNPFNQEGRHDHIQAKVADPLPLRSLVRCAICGSPMVAQRATGKNGKKYPYLACQGKVKKGREFCDAPVLNSDDIEPSIAKVLREMAQGDLERAMAEYHAGQQVRRDPLERERQKAQMDRDKTRKALARLVEGVEEGTLPASVVADRMRDLQEQVERLDDQCRRLDHEVAIVDVDREAMEAALGDIRLALANFETLESEEKAAVLQGFIAEIRLARGVDEMQVTFDLSGPVGQRIAQMQAHKKENPSAVADGFSHPVGNGEGLWADNAYTQDGKRVHKRVDRLDHVLDGPQPSAADDGGDEPPAVARSVSLSCERLGLTGKLDLVSTDGDEAVPVETKRGRVPDNAERSWEPERVQLMAQGLLLRSAGYRCDHGFLYFAASRRRVQIPFTPELEARTLDLLRQAQAQQLEQHIPDPLEDSPKCKGCSLAGICLPDETYVLRVVPPDAVAPTVRRLYPPRDEAGPLYVQEQGAWVGTAKRNLVVRKGGVVLAEGRLKDLDHLVLCGNVQIGTQAVHLLCEAGIPICHLSMGHWFYGFTNGFTLRNAYDRAAQFRAADDPARRLAFAQGVVVAKIANQRTLLQRNAEPRPHEALNAMARIPPLVATAADPDQLLGLEGTAARHYFGAFAAMIKPSDLAEAFSAEGRSRRPPPDPVNCLLSFGYALLSKECTVALAAVGLDPFWGFYHRPRHGRPSLALDLMEEFRPLVVDSAVLSACNTGMVTRQDCTIGKTGCLLKDTGRKAFIRAYEARLDQLATHPTLGYRVSWRVMIRLQARLLARWLRGDIPRYQGVTTR